MEHHYQIVMGTKPAEECIDHFMKTSFIFRTIIFISKVKFLISFEMCNYIIRINNFLLCCLYFLKSMFYILFIQLPIRYFSIYLFEIYFIFQIAQSYRIKLNMILVTVVVVLLSRLLGQMLILTVLT